MFDSFGDGWDKMRLVTYPSNINQKHKLFNPTCGKGEKLGLYCFNEAINEDGDYVVIKVVGFEPSHGWEVILQIIYFLHLYLLY